MNTTSYALQDTQSPDLGAALQDRPTFSQTNPLQQAEGVYVTLHGHFYQPPRENPYLGTIEHQSSAAPFHDWNERIYHECYRPNAFARICNDHGEVINIINNFEYLSFNMGPTLMSWLETYDTEVYQRIIAADRNSCERLQGHGNAIAQVYNHVIMPLANHRDKVTQVRWGKADFQARFGRDPEGMWLAEAAVDLATLEVLIAEDIQFIILAPSQAQRCRLIPEVAAAQDTPEDSHAGLGDWEEVGGGQIDPTRPYRCFLPGDRQRYIDIFFYDGPISRDIGFHEVLSSSQHLANRLAQAVRCDRKPSQLISIATDGETFGHHKRDTEKAIAYAFHHTFPQRQWTVTNYGHYLSLHPPIWEVELKPVTAWSCNHGVDRWQEDCGCGGEGSLWHQKWRRPLRDALDWLRDQLSDIYLEIGELLLEDPWLARDHYIQVIGQFPPRPQPDQSQTGIRDPLQAFLVAHQNHDLTPKERVDALRLLEMQRHALLMYTSCGWFFAELSRPEGVQILRYAAYAIALARDVAGTNLEPEFLERLALAPSNVELFQTGAGVYRQLVIPSQIDVEAVTAHYAITSLFNPYPPQHPFYCYQAEQIDYQVQRLGSLSLAVGQLQLTANVTCESASLIFAVLHLGGWDFHCGVQPLIGRKQYGDIKAKLFHTLQQASSAHLILAIFEAFGHQHYGLHDLLPEERHRLITLLSQETLSRLNQLYTQVYRDNYGLLMAFQNDDLEVPSELLTAAQVALNYRAIHSLQGLEQELSEPSLETSRLGANYLSELAAIATEAEQLGCRLKLETAQQSLEDLILRLLWQLFHHGDAELYPLRIQRLQQLLNLIQQLQIDIHLDRVQELYLRCLQEQLTLLSQAQAMTQARQGQEPTDLELEPLNAKISIPQLRQLLQIGRKLAVDVQPWLESYQ
jgi:alpha-amylase/alpha-mannosidase (GH57 family)